MSEEFKNKIHQWLDKHGFPLEMFVASVFRKRGFQVTQSVMYLDKETKLSREIDIVAYKTFQIDGYYLHFAAVIECKSTKTKPWLSFIVNSPSEIELPPWSYNATRHGEKLLTRLLKDQTKVNALFPKSISRHGYSLIQAFRNSDNIDTTYKAIQSLDKALYFLINKVGNRYGNIAFYFPMVVIDNSLFEIELENDGEIKIEDVQLTTYLGRKAESNSTYFVVNVMKEMHVEKYADLLATLIDDFYEKNIDQIQEFVKEYS